MNYLQGHCFGRPKTIGSLGRYNFDYDCLDQTLDFVWTLLVRFWRYFSIHEGRWEVDDGAPLSGFHCQVPLSRVPLSRVPLSGSAVQGSTVRLLSRVPLSGFHCQGSTVRVPLSGFHYQGSTVRVPLSGFHCPGFHCPGFHYQGSTIRVPLDNQINFEYLEINSL